MFSSSCPNSVSPIQPSRAAFEALASTSAGQDTSVPTVSVEACARRARLFYRLAGGAYELAGPTYTMLENVNETGQKQSVHFFFEQVPANEKHPIGASIECAFDLNEGLPRFLEMAYPPEYERARSLVTSEDAAEAAAMTAQAATGWSRVQIGVQKPRYRIPAFSRLANAMTDRHRRLEKEKKACLAYEISVNDASSYNPAEKRYERFVQVYVDAETGKAIAILPVYQMQGKAASVATNLSANDAVWTCDKAKGTMAISGEAAPKDGKPVVLRSEKGAWLLARYEPRSNSLFFRQGDVVNVFRPNDELAKGLKSYKPSRFSVQPKLVNSR